MVAINSAAVEMFALKEFMVTINSATVEMFALKGFIITTNSASSTSLVEGLICG